MPYAVAVPVVRAGRRDPDKPRAATELLRAMASWRRTRRRLPRATHGSRVPIEVLTRPSALVLFRRQPNSATATGTSRVWILASPVGARPTDEPTWQLNAWARKASTCQVRCTLVLYPHHSSYRIRMAGWVRTQAVLARGYQLPARCPRHGAWAPGACVSRFAPTPTTPAPPVAIQCQRGQGTGQQPSAVPGDG
jgi:hypothetical protein